MIYFFLRWHTVAKIPILLLLDLTNIPDQTWHTVLISFDLNILELIFFLGGGCLCLFLILTPGWFKCIQQFSSFLVEAIKSVNSHTCIFNMNES